MYAPKRLFSALALTLLAAAACDRTPTEARVSAPSTPALATNTSVVCKGTAVPTGYVILSFTNYYTCGVSTSGYPTAMQIGLPSSPESVCVDSPIPSNFVITSHGRRYDCDAYSPTSSTFKNTNSIKIPTASLEYVCDDSPIPSNYTSTSYSYYTSSCDRYGSGSSSWPNATRIQKL